MKDTTTVNLETTIPPRILLIHHDHVLASTIALAVNHYFNQQCVTCSESLDQINNTADYDLVLADVSQLHNARNENQRLHGRLQQTLRQLRIKNQQLEDMVLKLATIAATDPLTELANRRAFSQALDRSFAEAVRHNYDIACVMIDLDHFKQINDSAGHQHGDRILKFAAQVLSKHSRRSDIAGRYGGDEFVLVLPMTDLHTASHVAKRINTEFNRYRDHHECNTHINVTMSMGIATRFTTSADSPEKLIALADHALYLAKRHGKNKIICADTANHNPIAKIKSTPKTHNHRSDKAA